MLRGKNKRRISPEPIPADGPTPLATTANQAANSEAQELQETITIQARAIREMTTSLERASNLMEKQSETFTTEISLLNQAKTALEMKIQTLQSTTSEMKQQRDCEEPPPPPAALMLKSAAVPDAVEAAEFMSELDEMITNLQQVGATKSLPSIVKHLLTLFRYVFPAQFIEMIVLDPYSDGVYWSMSCRSTHVIGDNSSVAFNDCSGEKLEFDLLSEVIKTQASVVVKDGDFYPGNGVQKDRKQRRSKRQSFMSSSTKSNPTTTRYMSNLKETKSMDTWKETQRSRINTDIKSAVIVPVADTDSTTVLAVFTIVNRLNPTEGNATNFSAQDLELLKLFLNRCVHVFRQTRTMAGLLSAARRRHGTLTEMSYQVRHRSDTPLMDEGSATNASNSSMQERGDKIVRTSSMEQQLSQTKSWLKDQLLHREYKMIFQPNPSVQRSLRIFVITLRALSKFLRTLVSL